jgi:hypothetical protein
MTTLQDMAKLKMHSKAWFAASFEHVDVPDYIKVAAAKIASAYNIQGQSDPGYIANIINRYVNEKPTVCPVCPTGEHCDAGPKDTCIWCWQRKGGVA